MGRKPVDRSTVLCKECSKGFEYDPVHPKRQFCSNSCAMTNKWKSGNSGLGRPSSGKIKRTCPTCNKEYEVTEKGRKRNMFCSKICSIRSTVGSSLELLVREYLDANKVDYEFQYPIGYYVIDFLVDAVCIECDGRFHLKPDVKVRDDKRDEYLSKLGYSTIRLSLQEIWDNDFSKIDQVVNKYRSKK